MEDKRRQREIAREKKMADLKNFVGLTQSQLVVAFIALLGITVGSMVLVPEAKIDGADYISSVLSQQILDNESALSKSVLGTDTEGAALFADGSKKDKKKKEIEPVNINTASKLELMNLPGVGEKTADKIINYRKAQLFQKPEDIQKIKGIGPKKFDKMKKYVRV